MSRREIPSKPVRDYLKRAVLLNYMARVASALFVLLVIAGISIYAGAKWAFYNPPFGHAVVLYHAGVVLVALLLLRYWAWPRLRHPLSMRGMAGRLERGDSALHECLSSALDFSAPDPLLEQCLEPSGQLLTGFYIDTRQKIYERKRWRWIVPVYFWPLAVLVLGVATFWLVMERFEPFTPRDALSLYRMNFLQNPYRPMHSLIVEPGFAEVLKGDSIRVKASLTGPGYFNASITYNMAGFPEEVAEMRTLETNINTFEFLFENLQGDLQYRVKAGPFETVDYLVSVKIPAELTSVQVTYYYPVFMGEKTVVLPPGQGAAMAPIGTTVEVTTRWNRPMKEVWLSLNGGKQIPFKENASLWRGSFVLDSGGSYRLGGASLDDVPLRGNLEFPVQALVDLPPEMGWIFPEEDVDWSASKPPAKIPLQFRAEDDVGLESIFLYAGAPGRATQTHQIAQLDGKEKVFEDTFRFDWKPWKAEPVVRIAIEAVDNHPGLAGKKRTPTRRFYFQPPGSFEEIDESTQEVKTEIDPFEMIALRIFFLYLKQNEQNSAVSEETPPVADAAAWDKIQLRLMRTTSKTSLDAKESAANLSRGEAPALGPLSSATAEIHSGSGTKAENLPVRLDQVAERLGGDKVTVDELLENPASGPGSTVLDRQARQKDAVQKGFGRRAREEGDRAARELARAYKDLTGREPPKPADEIKPALAKAQNRDATGTAEDEAQEAAKAEGGDKPDKKKDGKQKEGETKGKSRLPGETFLKDGMETDIAGTTIDPNKKENEKDQEGLGGPSLPTNKYAPSSYKLDPNTVQMTTPQVVLMNKSLSDALKNADLGGYLRRPIPAEYESAAEEYNKVLLGE